MCHLNFLNNIKSLREEKILQKYFTGVGGVGGVGEYKYTKSFRTSVCLAVAHASTSTTCIEGLFWHGTCLSFLLGI